MRDLLPVVQPIADKLLATLVSQLHSDGKLHYTWSGEAVTKFTFAESKEVDILQWMSRGSLEYLCQALMGYSFNALDPGTPHEYADAVRRLMYVVLFAYS